MTASIPTTRSTAAALDAARGEGRAALKTRSGSGLSEDSLVDLAAELGLDVDQFTTDLDSAETTTAVEENAEVGYSLGVYNTPAFLLGGEPILGAQPTDVFVSAYEQALAEAG